MNQKKLIILLSALLTNTLLSQSPDIQFEKYTAEDGLSTSQVWTAPMEQDARGFLWVGTKRGLNRFDGLDFKIFVHRTEDSSSISNDEINDIYSDRKNRLWISTNDGLNQWIPESESFKRYNINKEFQSKQFPNRLFDIDEDANGALWIISGDQKPIKFIPEKDNELKYYRGFKDTAIVASTLYFVPHIDKDNIIWFLTDRGLHRYEENTGEYKVFNLPPTPLHKSPNPHLQGICETKDGGLILGGQYNELYYFNKKTSRMEQMLGLPENTLKLWIEPNKRANISGFPTLVFKILQTKGTGEYWISTIHDGLYRFDEDGDLLGIYGQPQSMGGLKPDAFTNIFEDRSQTLWFGSVNQGVYKVNYSNANLTLNLETYGLENFYQLKKYTIRSAMEDQRGNIWIGTGSGFVLKYDKSKRRFIRYSSSPIDNRGFGTIYSLYQNTQGQIFLGGYGLFIFDPDKDGFVPFNLSKRGADSLRVPTTQHVLEDAKGYTWIGGWGDYLPNKICLQRYTPDGKHRNFHFYSDSASGLSSPNIRILYEDRKGQIWIGTSRGLNRYLENTHSFQQLLPDLDVTSICEDNNGFIWVTGLQGLYKLDAQGRTQRHFSRENILPANEMGSIVKDRDGYLWIGYARGVLKLDPNNNSIYRLNPMKGAENDLYDSQRGSFLGSNGLLYLGGRQGFTIIDPMQYHSNQIPPDVQITDFRVFENSLKISANGPLRQSVMMTDQIELNHDQNDISIEYVGLHFKDATNNQYKYRLDPYDKGWQTVGKIRSARYTNLDYRTYHFRVLAANSDGYWNDEPATLTITINPPIWQTWWAYSAYVFFFFGFLYSVRRIELNRQRKNNELKESRLRAESAELKAKLAQAENERKSKELEEARQLQISMLPKELPNLPNLNIAVYMKTATEVGGDYYDFHVGMDGSLTVVLGDATGHGMKAGAMVTAVKSLFNSYAPNPDILFSFKEMTRCIKRMNFDRLAMCLTMLKIQGHRVKMSAAGMPPLFIFRERNKNIEEYVFEAMPLGTMSKFPYKIREITLQNGDTIVLTSDGLPELRNKKERTFGYDLVKKHIGKCAHRKPEELIENLKDAASAWADNGVQEDDITFVVLKMK